MCINTTGCAANSDNQMQQGGRQYDKIILDQKILEKSFELFWRPLCLSLSSVKFSHIGFDKVIFM